MNNELAFPYQTWDPQANKLVTRLDKPALPLKEAIEAMTLLVAALDDPHLITRFHATRPLAAEMKGPTLTFILHVSLRGQRPCGTESLMLLPSLRSDCICLRPESLRRSPLAEQIAATLKK